MSEPVSLDVVRNEPVPGVVAALEDMLEAARAGDLRAVGVFAKTADGGTATAYDTSEGGIAELNLALDRLKLRLLADTIEAIADEAW